MKIRLYIVFIGLFGLFFLSCEKTVFVDLPDNDQKIVINGILSPDSGLWVNLSKSISVTESISGSYIPIVNATIDYYENDNLIGTISSENSDYYDRDFEPQTNREYKIVVNAEGMPEASAVVNMPERVDIIDFDTTTVVNTFGSQFGNNPGGFLGSFTTVKFYVTFSFKDPETPGNHYMLGVYYEDSTSTLHPVLAESEDINMNNLIQDGINILAWDDQNFNGEEKDFTVEFSMFSGEKFETKIYIYLYSIEEDYFQYLKSYSQNYSLLYDEDILSEPVLVFSNVDGGLGIFAATISSYVSFDYTFN